MKDYLKFLKEEFLEARKQGLLTKDKTKSNLLGILSTEVDNKLRELKGGFTLEDSNEVIKASAKSLLKGISLINEKTPNEVSAKEIDILNQYIPKLSDEDIILRLTPIMQEKRSLPLNAKIGLASKELKTDFDAKTVSRILTSHFNNEVTSK